MTRLLIAAALLAFAASEAMAGYAPLKYSRSRDEIAAAKAEAESALEALAPAADLETELSLVRDDITVGTVLDRVLDVRAADRTRVHIIGDRDRGARWPAASVARAIGNVIDRVTYGYVVDFLDFHWGDAHFPAFNLADSAISVGAACLLLDEFLRVRRGDA